jgi:ribonuclease E
MSKEIYISSTPHETRLAVVEDDQLAEIYYERENEYTLAGSIYKGKVTRVLPGMQSAFVDIGLERDAFLYVTDFAEEQEDGEEYIAINATPGQNSGRGPSNGQPAQARREPQNAQPQPRQEHLAPASAEAGQESTGGRRWRGRRGRRRGRGHSQFAAPSQESHPPMAVEDPAEQEFSAGTESAFAEPDEFFDAPDPLEAAAEPSPQPVAAAPRSPEPILLPGESLAKYQKREPGTPRAAASPEIAAPAQTAASAYKPSTLITGPIEWDGSGLLPGESLARYKGPRPSAEPDAGSTGTAEFSSPGAEAGEQTAVAAETPQMTASTEPVQEPSCTSHPLTQPPADAHPLAAEDSTAAPEEPAEAPAAVVGDTEAATEPEADSASYRFDPLGPMHYRHNDAPETAVEEPPAQEIVEITEAEPEMVSPAGSATSEPAPEPFFGEAVSIVTPETEAPSLAEEASPTDGTGEDERIFNPGLGELEEETIEGDEAEAHTLHAFADEEEYDDLIEETLDVQMDSGLLSEFVRDRHIEERTRFNGDSEETAAEETAVSDLEVGELDLEEVPEIADESEEGEDDPVENVPAHSQRPRRGERDRGRAGHGGDRRRMRRATAQTSNLPAITELLKPNQEILVQIAKEPIARKGARITSHIALPGRFLVFMPTVNHVGVSRKIASDEERQRLKQILLSEKGAAPGGFIVRTAAATASEEDLRADIRFLLTLWSEIRQRGENAKPPALIYHDLNLVERVLRDQVTDNFSAIWVDSETDYERVLRFLQRFEPSLVRRVKLYTKDTPLFEQFGIQEEINKALRSKVWLKSGGSIVINQTEALVAIDINTGKYVGKTARLEDTILKTNLDAIPEIVRQIRLRDLGGIIVIDFIDMDERRNRHRVMQALEEALKADRAPSKVLQFNDFGLVAITRKRVRQSLERTLSVPCNTCGGTGMVKSPITVCNEIYIELRKMHRQLDRGDVLLRVHPEVVKQLKSAGGRWLTEMEEITGKTIIVKSDATLHPEQFDIH